MGDTRQEQEIAVPVSESVFDSLGTAPDELPPLADVIDLEALDSIIPSEPTPEVTVAFRYEGLRVLVHSGRAICVMADPPDGVDPLSPDDDPPEA
jgi:hypothetical protein